MLLCQPIGCVTRFNCDLVFTIKAAPTPTAVIIGTAKQKEEVFMSDNVSEIKLCDSGGGDIKRLPIEADLDLDSPVETRGKLDAETKIKPASTTPLVIPRASIADNADVGSDMDQELNDLREKKLRKPHRRDWIVLNVESEYPVRVLIHKPQNDSLDTHYYYVAPELQGAIRDEMKLVRLFLYWSTMVKQFALWPINVTEGNSWYESIAPLFKKYDQTFFDGHEIKIIPSKEISRYKVKKCPIKEAVEWPSRSMEEIVSEAFGNMLITQPSHEVYADLVAGELLR